MSPAACSPTSATAASGIPDLQLWVFLVVGIALIALSFFSKKSKKKKTWKKAYLLVGLLLILWSGYRFYEESRYTEVHLHANFKVFIDGKELDFAKAEYMTESKADHSKKVHLHDLNGGVAHVHYPGITWQDFFNTLGMKLENNCLDAGKLEKSCDLHFFINGKEVTALSEVSDLDQVLITNSQNTTAEIASVKDDACIYSSKCPERGPPKGMEAQGASCSA